MERRKKGSGQITRVDGRKSPWRASVVDNTGKQKSRFFKTEKEAKAFINGLINTAKYEEIRVSDIKKLEDGTYQIRCDKPNADLYYPVFSSLRTPVQHVSQTIEITVQDGKIIKIESTLSARGTGMYYGTVSFKLTSVCEF